MKKFLSGIDIERGPLHLREVTNSAGNIVTLNATTKQFHERTLAQILSDISGVPTSRTITINGTAQDLSADRTWNVGTVTSVGMTVPTGLTVAGSPITTSGTLAVSLQAGYSIPTTAKQTEWDTAYTNRITSLTTTGSSGAATLISNVLNIPNYTLAGLGGIGGTIAAGQVAFGTGANTIGGDGGLVWDNVNKRLGVKNSTPLSDLHIGTITVNSNLLYRSLILSGGYPNTSVRSQNLISFTSTTASSGDPFLENTGETNKNFHLGIVSDIAFQNLNRFSIIQGGIERISILGGSTAQTTQGNVGINTISPTNTLDVNGTTRIRTIANAAGNFVTTSATGVLQQRTAAEVRGDLGLGSAITGTGVAGQVAFFNGTGSVTGDSGITWDNANKRLNLGGATSTYRVNILGTTDSETIIQIIRPGVSTLRVGSSYIGTFSNNSLLLFSNSVERWSISSTGIFQSNGAQTIQTSTGNLTLATAAGNGNILINPNGTGTAIITKTLADALTNVLSLVNTSGTVNSAVSVRFAPTPASIIRYAEIFGINDGNNNISLGFTTGNGATIVERMRITGNNGNVLINTSTDSGDKLRVNGTVRIDSISNAIGDIVRIDANNVLRRRTVAETRVDLGLDASYQRDVYTYVATNVFTLTQTPLAGLEVYINGQKKRFGVDYTVSGTTLTIVLAQVDLPSYVSAEIEAVYYYSLVGITPAPFTGSGTTSFLTRWLGTSQLGVSLIQDNGSLVTLPAATDIPAVAATVDTDKFVVLDSNRFKFRTGAELLIDIGAASTSHTQNASTILAGTFATGDFIFQGNLDILGQVSSPSNAKGNSGTGTVTFNWNDGNMQTVTINGNCTFAFSNPKSGGVYQIIITRDATANRTITWPVGIKWGSGVIWQPSLANEIDIVTISYDGTTYFAVVTPNMITV